MARRVQSPSSINVYKQCPRKYFYHYILRLPTKPSIHLIRGSVVHEVLERFFSLNVAGFEKNSFKNGFRNYLTASFIKKWNHRKKEIINLGLSEEAMQEYFTESVLMIHAWLDVFSQKLEKKMKEMPIEQAFDKIKPRVEEEIRSDKHQVRGFIDVIEDTEEGIRIMDYKTSNKDEITPEYRLQLAIYALLFLEKYKKLPKQVGIHFLKFGEKTMYVDTNLVKEAEFEIEQVHILTESNLLKDYPKKESILCNWGNGQCDFYDECNKEN